VQTSRRAITADRHRGRLIYAPGVARWWPKTSVVLTTTQLRGEPMYQHVVEPAWWQWRLRKQVRRNRLR